MPALSTNLRNAVADRVAAGSYPYPFEIKRVHQVMYDLSDTSTTQVFVYPSTEQGRQVPTDTRKRKRRDYWISVHLFNYLDSNVKDDSPEFDNSMHLLELLEEELWGASLDTPDGRWMFRQFASETTPVPFYGIEQVVEKNSFHAVIDCLYSRAV